MPCWVNGLSGCSGITSSFRKVHVRSVSLMRTPRALSSRITCWAAPSADLVRKPEGPAQELVCFIFPNCATGARWVILLPGSACLRWERTPLSGWDGPSPGFPEVEGLPYLRLQPRVLRNARRGPVALRPFPAAAFGKARPSDLRRWPHAADKIIRWELKGKNCKRCLYFPRRNALLETSFSLTPRQKKRDEVGYHSPR